jgi:hypothetical protein
MFENEVVVNILDRRAFSSEDHTHKLKRASHSPVLSYQTTVGLDLVVPNLQTSWVGALGAPKSTSSLRVDLQIAERLIGEAYCRILGPIDLESHSLLSPVELSHFQPRS